MTIFPSDPRNAPGGRPAAGVSFCLGRWRNMLCYARFGVAGGQRDSGNGLSSGEGIASRAIDPFERVSFALDFDHSCPASWHIPVPFGCNYLLAIGDSAWLQRTAPDPPPAALPGRVEYRTPSLFPSPFPPAKCNSARGSWIGVRELFLLRLPMPSATARPPRFSLLRKVEENAARRSHRRAA